MCRPKLNYYKINPKNEDTKTLTGYLEKTLITDTVQN